MGRDQHGPAANLASTSGSTVRQNGSSGAPAMRSILALGLLAILCASAAAATVRHPRARQPAVSRPPAQASQPGANQPGAPRFAVPGWSDESTRQWLDQASSGVGLGG